MEHVILTDIGHVEKPSSQFFYYKGFSNKSEIVAVANIIWGTLAAEKSDGERENSRNQTF